jgi:hypothetical protein
MANLYMLSAPPEFIAGRLAQAAALAPIKLSFLRLRKKPSAPGIARAGDAIRKGPAQARKLSPPPVDISRSIPIAG